MLGEIVAELPERSPERTARTRGAGRTRKPRLTRPRRSRRGTKLHDVSFDLYPGEVLGVVALEGQGQDELFDILAGSGTPERWRAARGRRARLVPPPCRRDPGRPRVRRGRPRRGAAHAAVRPGEHRAAVRPRACAAGASSTPAGSERKVGRRDRHAADRRAGPGRGAPALRRQPAEGDDRAVGRRWRVTTMLCFDPTRGIDIRTKQQIYLLLRDLAEAGAAVLLYTSELKEVQLVCDRAIVDLRRPRRRRDRRRRMRTRPRCCAPPTTCASDAAMPEVAVGRGRRRGRRGGRDGGCGVARRGVGRRVRTHAVPARPTRSRQRQAEPEGDR